MTVIVTMIVLGQLLLNAQSQQPCQVDVPCSGNHRFAEYGNLPARDERAVLDNLAIQLRKSKDSIAYLLVYAGQRTCLNEARKRALRAKNYLTKKHGIEASRIVWKDGGFKVDLSTEIWLLPPGTVLPSASPQLDRSHITVVGKCKIPSFGP